MGGHHSTALTVSGSVYSWGWGNDSQLGHPSQQNELRPRLVEALEGKGIVQIDCGVYHTVALDRNGRVWAFGWGRDGRLGLGEDNLQAQVPTMVEALADRRVVQVACGSYHTAAVTDDGEVFTWGWAEDGRLGTGVEANAFRPTRVEALRGQRVTSVACGGHHTVFLTEKNEAYSCGWGEDGKLGLGDTRTRLAPEAIKMVSGKRVLAASCGYCHTALVVSGQLAPSRFGGGTVTPKRTTSGLALTSTSFVEGAEGMDEGKSIARRSPTPTRGLSQSGRGTPGARPARGSSLGPSGSSSSSTALALTGAASGSGSELALTAAAGTSDLALKNAQLEEAVRNLYEEKTRMEKLADEEIDALDSELKELENQLKDIQAHNRRLQQSEADARAQVEALKRGGAGAGAPPELEALAAKGQAAIERANALAAERAELQKTVSALKTRLAEVERDRDRTLKEMAESESETIKGLRQRIARLEQEVEHRDQTISDMDKQMASLRKQAEDELGARIAELERDNRQLAERVVHEREAREAQTQHLALTLKGEEDRAVEELRLQLTSRQNDLSKAFDDMEKVRQLLSETQRERARLQAEIDDTAAARERDFDALRRKHAQDLQALRSDCEARVADAQQDLEDVIAQLEKVRAEAAASQDEAAKLKSLSLVVSAPAAAAAEPSRDVAELQERVRALTEELSAARSSASEKAMDAETLARHLAAAKAEQAAMDRDAENAQRIIAQLEAQVRAAAGSPQAPPTQALALALTPGGAGPSTGRRRSVAEAESALEETRSQLARLAARNAELESRLHDSEAQIAQSANALALATTRSKTPTRPASTTSNISEAEIQAQNELIASLKRAEASHREEATMLRRELASMEESIRRRENELNQARGSNLSLSQALDQAREEIREQQHQVALARAAAGPSPSSALVSTPRGQLQTGAPPATTPGAYAADAARTITQLREELARAQAAKGSLENDVAQLTARWNADLDKIYSLEQQLRQVRATPSIATGAGGSSSVYNAGRSQSGNADWTSESVEETLKAQEAIHQARSSAYSLNEDQMRESLVQANIVMDQLHGLLGRLREELSAQRNENVAITQAWEKDKATLATRTAELMMLSVSQNVVDERETQNLYSAVGTSAGSQQPGGDTYLAMQRKLASLESRNALLTRELADTTHKLEFTATARDLLKKEIADLQDSVFAGRSELTRDKVDELKYLKQKLQQTEDRYERERSTLEQDRREIDELRRSLVHQKSGETWEQLMRVKSELEAALDTIEMQRSENGRMSEELQLARDQLSSSRANAEKLKNGIAELERDVDELHAQRRHDLEKHQRESSVAMNANNIAERDLHQAVAERDALRSEVAHLSALLQQAVDNSGKEGAAVTQVMREFEDARKEAARLAAETRRALQDRDAAMATAYEIRSQVQLEIDQVRHEKESADRNRDAALADLAELRSANESLLRQVKSSHKELSDLRSDREVMLSDISKLKVHVDNQAEQIRIERENTVGINRFKELQELLTQAKSESAGLAEELRQQRLQFTTFRNQAIARDQALRAELEAERDRLKDLLKSDRDALEAERAALMGEKDALQLRLNEVIEKFKLDRRQDAHELAAAHAALDRAAALSESEKREIADAFAAERESLRRVIGDLEDRIAERERALDSAKEAHIATKRFLGEIQALQTDNEALALAARKAEKQVVLLQQQLQHNATQIYNHSEAALQKAQEDARNSAQEAMLQTEIAKRREVQRMRLDLERAIVEAKEEKHHAIEQARVQFEERLQQLEADKRRAMARMQADLDALRQENYSTRQEAHGAKLELEEFQRMFRDTETGNPYNLIDTNAKMRNENEDLRRRLAHLEQVHARIKNDKEEVERASRVAESAANKRIMELETQLTIATLDHGREAVRRPEVAKAKEVLEKANRGARELDAIEYENKRLRAQIAELREAKSAGVGEAARESLELAKQENARIHQKMLQLREEYEFLVVENQELSRKLQSSLATASERRAEKDDQKSTEVLRAQIAKLKTDMVEYVDRVERAEADNRNLTITNRQLEQDLQSINRENITLGEELAAVTKEKDKMKAELLAAGRDPRGALGRDTDADLMDRRELVREREKLERRVVDLEAQLDLARLGSGVVDTAPQVPGVSNRSSGLQRLKIEEDMEVMRERMAPVRSNTQEGLASGRPLFDNENHVTEVSREVKEFEKLQSKLHELWALRQDLQNSTVERLNPKQSRKDGVKELLAMSNSRIDGVLSRIRRARDSTKYQQGDLYDHVSELLIENGEAYKRVNDYSEALLGATLDKLEKLKKSGDAGGGAGPAAKQQNPVPEASEPGFFESLFDWGTPAPAPAPPPAEQPAARPQLGRSRSRFDNAPPKH
jgi:chromosome segregation ATPase